MDHRKAFAMAFAAVAMTLAVAGASAMSILPAVGPDEAISLQGAGPYGALLDLVRGSQPAALTADRWTNERSPLREIHWGATHKGDGDDAGYGGGDDWNRHDWDHGGNAEWNRHDGDHGGGDDWDRDGATAGMAITMGTMTAIRITIGGRAAEYPGLFRCRTRCRCCSADWVLCCYSGAASERTD